MMTFSMTRLALLVVSLMALLSMNANAMPANSTTTSPTEQCCFRVADKTIFRAQSIDECSEKKADAHIDANKVHACAKAETGCCQCGTGKASPAFKTMCTGTCTFSVVKGQGPSSFTC